MLFRQQQQVLCEFAFCQVLCVLREQGQEPSFAQDSAAGKGQMPPVLAIRVHSRKQMYADSTSRPHLLTGWVMLGSAQGKHSLVEGGGLSSLKRGEEGLQWGQPQPRRRYAHDSKRPQPGAQKHSFFDENLRCVHWELGLWLQLTTSCRDTVNGQLICRAIKCKGHK